MTMMTIPEDRDFLSAQRESGRRGKMLRRDEFWERKRAKEQVLKRRRSRAHEESAKIEYIVQRASSSSSDEDGSPIQGASAAVVLKPERRNANRSLPKRGLSAELDRNKSSDRAAMMIVNETVKTFGQDTQQLALNRSSISREREAYREQTASSSFNNTDGPLEWKNNKRHQQQRQD